MTFLIHIQERVTKQLSIIHLVIAMSVGGRQLSMQEIGDFFIYNDIVVDGKLVGQARSIQLGEWQLECKNTN